MLASQRSHRRFIPANHDRPARPALVDFYGAPPCIAARHEDQAAHLMHRVVGLNGQLPGGVNGMIGLARGAEENRAVVLSDLRQNGPSTTRELAVRLGLERNRAAHYLSALFRLGQIRKTQANRQSAATWRVEK